MRDSWNVLDCVIVCTSIVGLVLEESGKGGILSCSHALRSLRGVIRRFPGMRKVTVVALPNSFSSIAHIMLLMVTTVVVFAITVVHWKKGGTFYECRGPVWEALTTVQQEFATHPPTTWADFTTRAEELEPCGVGLAQPQQ